MALVPSAHQASSSPSSSSETRHLPCIYDVFLSFRGEDTRKTFTDHLYTAFIKAGFHTFRDNDELERGEDIKPKFQEAIQQSRSSVIVFSRDYASSGWCLDELVMILQRKRTSNDHVVLPVFYDVDPSHLRKQTGKVAKAFAQHDTNQSVKHKVDGWRKALTEVADLAGMDLNQADGYESKFIEEIVKVIEDKLPRPPLSDTPYLIGINSRVEKINLWLEDESFDANILLIYGMPGIGKTTITKFVYNSDIKRFQGKSFLENVREISRQPNGVLQMQKQLLSDLNGRKVKIHSINEGIRKIEKAISSKKVLLIFDDVDHVDQLDAVFRMHGHLYQGSKVIITTSNVGSFKARHQHLQVHEVRIFDDWESLELFSWHAFGKDHPKEDYMEYSKKVVQLCEGLPLALKVLGSSLFGKSIVVWESAIEKLRAIPNCEIMNKLKLSYDSLGDDHDQNLFLHIACFFIGMNKHVIVKILDDCDFYTVIGIENLIERCLVTIGPFNEVHMHHLIRDMGREIVRLESPKLPEKRSRLWYHNDSFEVLTKKKGTETIEGLILIMEMHPTYNPSNEVVLESNAFAMMHKLRLLMLSHVQVNGSYEEFPKDLRCLSWNEFPFDYLPNDFPLESLVALEMCFSSLKQVWKETKCLPSLKILNLSHSHDLIETPDFLHIPNLEILILKDCANLVNVHESIGSLKRLVHLDMEDCINIRVLPKNIGMLKFLETFILSGCSNLIYFPVEMRDMKSLKKLDVGGIPLHRLSRNPEIVWASYFPQNLVNLSLRNCNLVDDDFPMDFGNLSGLQRLDLSFNPITCLPNCIRGLTRLHYLSFNCCTDLKSLVRMPELEQLEVNGCTLLETVTGHFRILGYGSNYNIVELGSMFKLEPIERVEIEMTRLFGSINLQPRDTIEMDTYHDLEIMWKKTLPIQVLYECGIISTFVPGSEIPSQFSHKSIGSSISFTVPSLSDQRIQGLNIVSVYAKSTSSPIAGMLYPLGTQVSNKSKGVEWSYNPHFYGVPGDGRDLIWLSHWPYWKEFEVGDEVTVSVFMTPDYQVKECGIMLVYEQEENMMSSQHNTINPYVIGEHLPEILPDEEEVIRLEVDGTIEAQSEEEGTRSDYSRFFRFM